MKESLVNLFRLNLDSYAVLILLVFTAFVIPIFPDRIESALYDICVGLLFLWAILNSPRHRTMLIVLVVFSIIARWAISPYFETPLLEKMAAGINTLVFVYVVVLLILDVANVKIVSAPVILDAINGYLLLGLAFSSLIAYIHYVSPGSFNIEQAPGQSMADYNYFGFVTISTLGYGDIVPKTPAARSVATLGSVAGQMYVAVVVALLVGKFASMDISEQEKE